MHPKRIALIVAFAALAFPVFPAVSHAAQPTCVAAGSSAVRQSPAKLPSAYRACAPRIAEKLRAAGIPDTPMNTRGLFAAAVANRYAPYGNNRIATNLDGLRPQKTLACYMYALLTVEVYARIGGNRDDILFVGWDHGAVGNHAQLILDRNLLLDPTTGLAAPTTLRHLAYGGSARTADLGFNDLGADGHAGHHFTDGFRAKVKTAIEHGLYKRSDVLYTMTYEQSIRYNRAVIAAQREGQPFTTVPLPSVVV